MKANAVPAWFITIPKRWLGVGLLLFFVLLSWQYILKVHFSERDNRSAFLRWREQILAVSQGQNIWETFEYPNPPIMVLLLEPLAKLPPLVGSLAWFFLKVAMALAALTWVFALVETHHPISALGDAPGVKYSWGVGPFPFWGKALVFFLSLRPIMGDLSHGNINLFILFLVIGALYAFHRRHDTAAGLVLALAITAKVTPLLFVPYFLWKRAWRTLLSCCLGLFLFFWLIPSLFLGANNNQEYLNSWVKHMIVPFVVEGKVTTEHHNQSLPGLIHRLTTRQPSFTEFDFDQEQYVPLQYHNWLTLDPEHARWLVKGCMGLFALLVICCCRTPIQRLSEKGSDPLGRGRGQTPFRTATQPRGGWRLAAEYSLILLGMLLFSERTWKHHCVILMLPFAVLVYHLTAGTLSRTWQYYLIGTLAAAALLMAATSTGLGDQHQTFGKLAQVYGAYVWAYILLVLALVLLLRRSEKGVPGPDWPA